jgi:hypothetical protein
MLDWDAICRIEPELLTLEQQAKLLGPDSKYDGYESMKKRMYHYVGWGSTKEELRDERIWETAMQHIAMRCAP